MKAPNIHLSSFSVVDSSSSADARLSERPAQDSVADCEHDSPRTVIRGESPNKENDRSQAALTDWLNISFPFHPESNNPLTFFKGFSKATNGILGGMTDQERGLHGWNNSFRFDRGCVMFAHGGQRNTVSISVENFPGISV